MTEKRNHLRPDGIPSRCDKTLMSSAETSITKAMYEVENSGGSKALTDAINLLSKARDRVADHVEGIVEAALAKPAVREGVK